MGFDGSGNFNHDKDQHGLMGVVCWGVFLQIFVLGFRDCCCMWVCCVFKFLLCCMCFCHGCSLDLVAVLIGFSGDSSGLGLVVGSCSRFRLV